VKEIQREGTEMVEKEMKLTKSSVVLNAAVKMSASERKELVLNLILDDK